MTNTPSPTAWQPRRIEDFIGVARRHGLELARIRLPKLNASPDRACLRAIFYGPPGCGKSELAKTLAMELTGSPFAIEHLNGQSVSVDLVRDWSQSAVYKCMFGTGWQVKIIDEFDRMSQAAVFEMHTHLDRKHPRSAFLMTTNKDYSEIPAAFQTRANLYKFYPVTAAEIAKLLQTNWKFPPDVAMRIAVANDGNVRGALFDAERELDKIELEKLMAA